MRKRNRNNQKGMTILEVLIAMIILGMSLLLLLNMAMVALDGNDWSNKTTIATQAMQEKLEQLRNTINTVSSGTGNDTIQGVLREWTVSNAGSHLRQVSVSVTWENIRGADVTNSMTAFIKTDSI